MDRLGWLARVSVFLLAFSWGAGSALAQNEACPEGQAEIFNVNTVGCYLCSQPESCDVVCVGSPACLCEGPGREECCRNTPCCSGCPDAGSLACNVSSCVCDPEECCSLACPNQSMAPVADPPVLVLTALVLAAVGIVVLANRASRSVS